MITSKAAQEVVEFSDALWESKKKKKKKTEGALSVEFTGAEELQICAEQKPRVKMQTHQNLPERGDGN